MSPAVFGHGALRLYLLSLLADAPRHGYELMQALEQRFGGTYSPSAGTIYPRLAKLEEEGLVTKTVEGRKATYAITDAGRAELAAREHELRDLEAEITDSVRRMASEVREGVRSAMRSLRADLAAAERDARDDARDAARDARRDARDAARDAQDAARDARPGADEPWTFGFTWGTGSGSSAPVADGFVPNPGSPPAPSPGPRPAPPSAPDPDDRLGARLAAHDIDLRLAAFRQEVRRLARRDRAERLSADAAARVAAELDGALARIRDILR
ncbi:PadR family transcriptional regulator [Agrococcus terreus]|uniref:Transcription regulator PadR N-terminal domain-containing protein n=1 Tax=Agrococcus terreus TaxID=574649 RepID=A0ABQ2KEA8_9MICO|nr:hypothetical protein GCM10010968_05720 [Agrococcus terreus]